MVFLYRLHADSQETFLENRGERDAPSWGESEDDVSRFSKAVDESIARLAHMGGSIGVER